MSIELSLEDVKRVALHYGFEFEVSLVHDNSNFLQISRKRWQNIWTVHRKRGLLKQHIQQILDQWCK